ncbi:unnamed protein product [Brugia timori]|uniref:Uncharacterized protein n=1 Tax=Brugia timori TaxID=42155 RepID=A0A0R3QXM1_9BILA|nr:unnamed protein product [Brugia timori]
MAASFRNIDEILSCDLRSILSNCKIYFFAMALLKDLSVDNEYVSKLAKNTASTQYIKRQHVNQIISYLRCLLLIINPIILKSCQKFGKNIMLMEITIEKISQFRSSSLINLYIHIFIECSNIKRNKLKILMKRMVIEFEDLTVPVQAHGRTSSPVSRKKAKLYLSVALIG